MKRPSSLPLQISTRYLQFGKSAGIGKLYARFRALAEIPFYDSLDLPAKASCLLEARRYEAGTVIPCDRYLCHRYLLTYYSLFYIFNPIPKQVLIIAQQGQSADCSDDSKSLKPRHYQKIKRI
jgi:hypothetical protein